MSAPLRRRFLRDAGIAAAGALAAPAVVRADSLEGRGPELKWDCVSSFPMSLDTIYVAAEIMAKRVALATGNRFRIQVSPAGKLVPGPKVFDAVKEGTVQMGHTASYYYVGKDPTFAFDTAVPFGLNSRQQSAWMFNGGGLELMRDLFRPHNIHNIPLGNTGVQMGGWYLKEIRTVDDLKGLRMRIGGLAGQVLARLGVVTQQLPGAEIYPALEKGTIDAAEWVGPYDDLQLGFYKVAKYYYYPGFWEGGPQLTAYVNLKHWQALPEAYQAILTDACAVGHIEMQTRYDAKNPRALKELVGGGTILKAFPAEVMAACYKATLELYTEIAATNTGFKKVLAAYEKFRDEQLQWFGVAENRYDNFMQATRAAPRKP